MALLTIISSLLAVVGLAVAGAQPPTTPPPSTPSGTPSAQLSPEDQARRAKVVAKVGDETITIGEIEDAIESQPPQLRGRFRERAMLEELVKNMVRMELIAYAAQKRGYGDNPAVVRAGKDAAQKMLRRSIEEQITPEGIPQEDVQAYYDAHPEEFNREEMVKASHILVADRARAVELIREAKEGDARKFRQLARDNSLDNETKLRGGDLRFFNREGRALNSSDAPVDAALVAAAFGLREVNDVVREPVQVGSNWSVVMLTGRRPAEHRSIEDAAPGIRQKIARERREKALEDLVTQLRERHRPEIHADRMEWIRIDEPEENKNSNPLLDKLKKPQGKLGKVSAHPRPEPGPHAEPQQEHEGHGH